MLFLFSSLHGPNIIRPSKMSKISPNTLMKSKKVLIQRRPAKIEIEKRRRRKMSSKESPTEKEESPNDSLQTISDDDEIDYTVKPEFYDENLDEKDELWVQKRKKGQFSDAVLSCPACFTTLCLECQRHEKYATQYRAIFVVNCKMKSEEVLQLESQKRKRSQRGRISGEDTVKPVCCSVCSTEVGVMDEEEVYHFFNVLPSEP